MREPREKIILLHIQEDIHDILLFTHDLDFIKFKGDNLVKKAVSMSLLNIGELAKELPAQITSRYPAVPWKNIIGLRNRTAHGYHSLDAAIIWEIALHDIPILGQVVDDALLQL